MLSAKLRRIGKFCFGEARRSRHAIHRGYVAFENNSALDSIDWKTQSGKWVMIDAATMMAIGIAVGRHVQACFSREKALSDLIVPAANGDELDAVDIDTDWPDVAAPNT